MRAAGGLDLTLPSVEDWDMWLAEQVRPVPARRGGRAVSTHARRQQIGERARQLPVRRPRRQASPRAAAAAAAAQLYAKAHDYFRWGYGEQARLLAHPADQRGRLAQSAAGVAGTGAAGRRPDPTRARRRRQRLLGGIARPPRQSRSGGGCAVSRRGCGRRRTRGSGWVGKGCVAARGGAGEWAMG